MPPNDFLALAETRRGDMEAALGSMLADDKKRFIMLAIRGVQNHKHKDGGQCRCTQESMVQCVIDACLMGLEVGTGNDHAYLIPYGNELTLRPGYKGLIYRAVDAGIADHIYAELVRGTDKVEVDGTKRTVHHEFDPFKADRERGPLKGVYAVAILSNGLRDFEALNVDDIAAIQRKAAAGSMMWKEFPGEAWKKSAIRRLIKRLQGGRKITGDEGRKLAAALEVDNKDFDAETTATRVTSGETTLDKTAADLPDHDDPPPPEDPVINSDQQKMLVNSMVDAGYPLGEILNTLEKFAGCEVGKIKVSMMGDLLKKLDAASPLHAHAT